MTLGDLEYLLGLERDRRNVAVPECVIKKMEQQNEEFRRLQEYERSRSGKEQTDS